MVSRDDNEGWTFLDNSKVRSGRQVFAEAHRFRQRTKCCTGSRKMTVTCAARWHWPPPSCSCTAPSRQLECWALSLQTDLILPRRARLFENPSSRTSWAAQDP